jgi:hypothetical protein
MAITLTRIRSHSTTTKRRRKPGNLLSSLMRMTKMTQSGWSMTLQLLRCRRNYNLLAPFSAERFPMKLTCVKNSRSGVTGTSYRNPNRRMNKEKTTISWMTSSMRRRETSMQRSDAKLRD